MKKSHMIVASFCVAALFGPSMDPGYLSAQEPETVVTPDDLTQDRIYSPFADRAYPDQVLFGDTHLHTELSPDAGLLGTSLTLPCTRRIDSRAVRRLSRTPASAYSWCGRSTSSLSRITRST